MCLVSIGFQAHPRLPLVLVSNRDEYHARPADPAAWWADAPGVLAGRDRSGGGTWLGVSRGGRVAVLTNYRAPRFMRASPGPSRGGLVRDFLRAGAPSPAAWGEHLRATRGDYLGYTLLFGDADALWCYESVPDRLRTLPAGVHALSNHLLNTPWPKTRRVRRALDAALGADRPEAAVPAFRDRAVAPDAELPDTGIGHEAERFLSSPFIVSDDYGTRATTLVTITDRAAVRLSEWRYAPTGEVCGETHETFVAKPDGAGIADD